jgi:hypothetical protein
VQTSEPFFAKTAQAAHGVSATSRSAELDEGRAGTVVAAAVRGLARAAAVDRRMVVAEHDRPVAADEVEVLVPVDVPQARAVGAREERRIRARHQHARRLVAVDAARDHALGARRRARRSRDSARPPRHQAAASTREHAFQERIHRGVGAPVRLAAPLDLERVRRAVEDQELARRPGLTSAWCMRSDSRARRPCRRCRGSAASAQFAAARACTGDAMRIHSGSARPLAQEIGDRVPAETGFDVPRS